MPKQTIAVDVDDVLADMAPAFVAYSNKVYGTNLTVDDYNEHWSKMWQVDVEETSRRAHDYHETDHMSTYKHRADALPVLHSLSKDYKMIIVTARRRQVSDITTKWIDKHYPDIFESINFAGIWDSINHSSHTATKAELCLELGVDYLIDDQSKHCNAAAEEGITALMFGDYPWSRHDALHEEVIKCHTWADVERYFHGKPTN